MYIHVTTRVCISLVGVLYINTSIIYATIAVAFVEKDQNRELLYLHHIME
jgi:hypothetical protein